jgi:hypothetical protein
MNQIVHVRQIVVICLFVWLVRRDSTLRSDGPDGFNCDNGGLTSHVFFYCCVHETVSTDEINVNTRSVIMLFSIQVSIVPSSHTQPPNHLKELVGRSPSPLFP